MNKLSLIILTLILISCNQTTGQKQTSVANGANETAYEVDFSPIWKHSEPDVIFGIIGEEHQRLYIKFNSVEQDSKNTLLYHVTGTSQVKNNSCDFTGEIKVEEVNQLEQMHYGVDDEYKEKGIQSQGIVIGTYEFHEDKTQEHSGTFKGTLESKYYVDKSGKVLYDDIELQSDSYANNQFSGTWTSYASGNSKLANWGDYRVPGANEDFDVGAAEFSPSEKYYDKGWGQSPEPE